MDLGGGVCVSSLSADKWEVDQEVGGEVHMLCHDEHTEAGLWRYLTPPPEPIRYTSAAKRETLLVLEGESRIEVENGPTVTVMAGEMVSLPEGATTTWHLKTPYRAFWVFA